MASYFITYYGTFSFNHYLGIIVNSVPILLVLLEFKKDKSMFYKIPLGMILNYAIITFVSAIYFGLFPDSQYGYFVTPVFVCSILYVLYSFLFNRKFTLGRAINITLICCFLCYLPPLFTPIVMQEMGNSFLNNFKLISYSVQLAVSILSSIYLNRFSFDGFQRPNIFTIVLIFSVCVVGYLIDGIAIVLIDIPIDKAVSYNFFLCIMILFLQYVCSYICYFINKRSEKETSVRLENERVKRELEMLKSYELGYTQVRMVKHDIEGQYAVIESMLKQGQYDDAINYFDSLKIMVAPLYQNVYSDNRVVNLACNMANEKGNAKGVKLNYKVAVPKELNIHDSSLTSILNNLFTNCIDGVKDLPEDKRTVDVSIALMDSFIAIRTANYCDKTKIKFDKKGNLITSKADKATHGYGTKIILKAAKENGGIASFKVDGDKFIADVLLQDKGEQK